MNLWLVNHYAKAPGRAGGNRHFSLARELQEHGHKVTIIASSFDHFTRQELRLHSAETYLLEEVDGVRYLWLKTPAYSGNSPARVWNMASFLLRVLRVVSPSFLGRPDVVWGSSPHLFAGLAAERLARRYGVPFVLEVRDLWPQTLIDLGGISPWHPFIRILSRVERYLYRRSARIISLLPLAHLHMQEKGANPAKVVWIPNGVDLRLVPPPTPPISSSTDTFTVMYAGSHGVANNLERIVEAAALVTRQGLDSRIKFRMIGDGPEKPRLMELAERLGARNLSFEAQVAKAEIYDRLGEADCFIAVLHDSPLYKWGYSLNKLFDYLAMARPIIWGQSQSSVYDPVSEAGAGLTVPGNDSRALAEAVIRVASMSPEDRWAMGLRGRQYVEAKHSYQLLAGRVGDLLEDLLRNS